MKPKRILVIDDDQSFTEMVKLNLDATGDYEACIENHSPDAIETARQFQPDLILLDCVMPGMDGGDVAFHLQQDVFLRSIPVVMVTALVSNQEMGPDGTLRAGGQLMVAKPVSVPDLLQCIESQLASAV